MAGVVAETRVREDARRGRSPDAVALGTLWLGFALVALGVFGPALRGDFVSDDFGYIVGNPYIHRLSPANTWAILDPYGEPARLTANWAPLHLLGHALEWSVWGPATAGYHVVNVLLHALTATLLALLLARRGIPEAAAALAGLVFLVHPANVEAVAWIFQLKTIGALLCAQAALLAHPRRPLVAAVCFAAALLFKAAALFALPVAAAFTWLGQEPGDPWRERRRWLLAWLAIALLYAGPQFLAFERVGSPVGVGPDGWERLRTPVAIGARYLAMATTSYGTSTFQEPAPAASWLDPWWLAGLALGGILAARIGWAVAWRREEAAWWLWAAAAWAPVSQIFPFLYPMADRYLYTILPGLLGGALFACRDPAGRLARRFSQAGGPRTPERIAALGVLALAILFGLRSHERAAVWRSDATLTVDTILHTPDGISANMLRAAQAGRSGDARAAARAARRAHERGFDRFMVLEESADFASVRHDPAFQAVIAAMARRWTEDARSLTDPTQEDLRMQARAYTAQGDLDKAEALLNRALAMGGRFTAAARADLERVRSLRQAKQRRGLGPRP